MEGKEIIALTGGTGFIGVHLRKKLLAEGYHVRILSRKTEAEVFEGEERIVGDLLNEGSINELLAGASVLIHLAAELKDPQKFHSTNITAVELLATLAQQHKVPTVIHLSSVGVSGYGHKSGKWINTEESECFPTPGYEQTKFISEKIWNQWAEKDDDNRLVILRPTNVFGDHHPRKALLGLFKHVISSKRFPFIEGSVVNYLYVGDLVESIYFFLKRTDLRGTYNVGYPMRMNEFVSQIEEVSGKKAKLFRLPYFLVRWGVHLPVIGSRLKGVSGQVEFSDTKLRSVGFSYPFGVKDGLKRTYAYFRELGEL